MKLVCFISLFLKLSAVVTKFKTAYKLDFLSATRLLQSFPVLLFLIQLRVACVRACVRVLFESVAPLSYTRAILM